MDRPALPSRRRLRMEFRLRKATAEAVYRYAREWDTSLSEAGDRLIHAGAAALGAASKKIRTEED